MDLIEIWISLEREISVALPRYLPDEPEILYTIRVFLRRMRKCIETLKATNCLIEGGENQKVAIESFENIAEKARPQKPTSRRFGCNSQRYLSAKEITSLCEALERGCHTLESVLSISQYQQYQLAFWRDSLELLAQGQVSEAEALVRTISALQLSNSSSRDLAALCQIKRSLVRHEEMYAQQDALQHVQQTRSYPILQHNLECYSEEQQTLGTLRVDSTTQIPVYIEWKIFKEDSWLQERLLRQVHDLSAILGSQNAHILKLLTCRGVVHGGYEDGSLRCGLVYELPAGTQSNKHQRLQTLHSLLDSNFHPSLTARFRLARDLATGLLHLHTVGWVHKEIRSCNVLLFPSSMSQRSLDNPRLMGLTYARSDNGESQHISYKPKVDFDLWRHPQYQRNKEAVNYRPAYDMYSLGLVLFEIGRWKALDKIYSMLQREDDFELDITDLGARLQRRDFQRDLWKELEYHTGDVYAQVVSSCISREYDMSGNEELITFMLEKVVSVLDALAACLSIDG